VNSIEILGCRVDAVGPEDALERIVALSRSSHPSIVVTLGTEMVVEAQHNAAFRAQVNAAALSLCDTVGLLWASRLRRGPLRERVAGVELVEKLAQRSASDDVALYFLGGVDGVAECAALAMFERYPGARIAGWHHGYFTEEQTPAVAATIASSGARVLCLGLGSPRQELWLGEHLAACGAAVGIGVGGSFDILSGRSARAPRFLCALGLEWLYRLVREPRRWRRQLALPRFALLVLGESMGAALRRRLRTI
jgi:N-acetylglucosaminyldiphosphoundecaprenol N-acetyl-beta-D-mannosaminyltransferase